MIAMLLAYDLDGNVIATLDYLVSHDEGGEVLGLIDFSAYEDAGGEHTDIWSVEGAKGSKVWPEWLGTRAHDFRVELVGPAGKKRIVALVHKGSGHRRERSALEAEIGKRVKDAKGAPADIRDLVGGPDRPLVLDADGKTVPRPKTVRPNLPLVGRL